MAKLHRGWGLASLATLGPLQAADIYRWVDEQGRTHLSDVVSDRWRDSAIRIDPRRVDAAAAARSRRADGTKPEAFDPSPETCCGPYRD